MTGVLLDHGRDGQPERHFRTMLTGVEEIVAAFVAFSAADPALYTRFRVAAI
jgi:hypothetical protein